MLLFKKKKTICALRRKGKLTQTKLKQQQQRHEKRSEKYQKMGVKKIEGEKS